MKKFAFLFLSLLMFTACETDDDGPTIAFAAAEITNNDLPEFFEPGETYDIKVTYELPTACHNFEGMQGYKDEFDVYLQVVTSYDPELAECDQQGSLINDTTLDDFKALGEDGDVYTFHFYTGADSTGQAVYETMDVPVGAPEDNSGTTN